MNTLINGIFMEINVNGYNVLISDADVDVVSNLNLHTRKGRYSDNIYVGCSYQGKPISLHRLIMGDPVGLDVDHINGNTLDNRRENLRSVTRRQNVLNIHRVQCNNTTGYFNVGLDKKTGRYVVTISSLGTKYSFGGYPCKDQAGRVANMVRRMYHGSGVKLNDIDVGSGVV